ncbi:tyrosine-type recombinase/integrase [Azospirillum sp. TSO35-2]|uniref:tyrosine-type recombinase/integrase n=1 Tax=Azospirillum sp. TSO35-2 TaxID=716796 RepID=UPI000D60E7F9|nr:tyrosine-type recombinase/integrase [Azospirillum sp. TSO35-2]PWC31413.1 hypothetical protein TSO352_32135 [Azospirillum sp. TSO35-2]
MIDHLPIPSSATLPAATADAPPTEAIQANLERHAHAARGAYARNTERALRADTAVFVGWCQETDRAALPATADTVAAFVDAMAEARKPATVRRYVASVASLHRAAGLPSPTEDATVRLAVKRMHRAKGRRQEQAHGLTNGLRGRLLDAARERPIDLRDKALLMTAYDTGLRRAELVALRVEDLEEADDGSGSILVRKGKTDPEGTGRTVYLAPDTLRAVAAWRAAAGITAGLLFRSVCKGGTKFGASLDEGAVARIIKRMAKTAGVAPEVIARLSGHSGRVGMAQDMAACRLELAAIMQAGGWKSPAMVARYTERQAVRRSAAARLAESQGRV